WTRSTTGSRPGSPTPSVSTAGSSSPARVGGRRLLGCPGLGRTAGGVLPRLPPLKVPPLPREGVADPEPVAVDEEPVGGRPVADVDGQAPHVHRTLRGEHPACRLLHRAVLLDRL